MYKTNFKITLLISEGKYKKNGKPSDNVANKICDVPINVRERR